MICPNSSFIGEMGKKLWLLSIRAASSGAGQRFARFAIPPPGRPAGYRIRDQMTDMIIIMNTSYSHLKKLGTYKNQVK